MPIFDIQTHLDFYNMLVEDFDEFMREQHSARHAFHCILDAYHLREWLWHDLIENNQNIKAALKIKKRKRLQCVYKSKFSVVFLPQRYYQRQQTFRTRRAKI